MVQICGYSVVEKTKHGHYHGISSDIFRTTWDVIGADYYAKVLPSDLLPIHNEYAHYGPFYLVFSVDFALRAAEYSRGRGYDVEIIGVYSEEWELRTGAFSCQENLQFLGYDPVGPWSLLSAALFELELFLEWKARLNQYGLFKNKMDANCFVDFYTRNMEPDGPLEEPGDEVSIIEVYRLVEK